jgi:hypothetical protein
MASTGYVWMRGTSLTDTQTELVKTSFSVSVLSSLRGTLHRKLFFNKPYAHKSEQFELSESILATQQANMLVFTAI